MDHVIVQALLQGATGGAVNTLLSRPVEAGVKSFLSGCERLGEWVSTDLLGLQPSSSFADLHIPKLPKHNVGLENQVGDLRRRLFEDSFNKIGVRGIGGSGKTTLVAALCRDDEVRKHFGDKIIFQVVSQLPDNKKILENIWRKITGDQPVPDSQSESIKEALEEMLRHKRENILVILDDVGPNVNLEELFFEAEGCKFVVTVRDSVNSIHLDSTYYLSPFGEEDALSLFCSWAFGQETIPDGRHKKQLVEEVAKECLGLPLVLKVTGRYLHKYSEDEYWEYAKTQLSQGRPIKSKAYEEDVLKRLAVSLQDLEPDTKKCFLDLILFPEVKRIPVGALFDIWIHVHNLSQEYASMILVDLQKRGLLDLLQLTPNPRNCEIYAVQHDMLQRLAIYCAESAENNQNDKICKRLRLSPFSCWEDPSHGNIKGAEIIAIRTGPMKENKWPKLEFPEALALVLIFDGNEYFLPAFVQKMSQLKILIIINQKSRRTRLDGMSSFSSLAQLKSLRLEKLIVPDPDHLQYLENLRKLSLSLCSTGKGRLDIKVCSKLLKLEEIFIDCCEDMEEFPVGICTLTSLKTLSITNCHQLHKIPEDLGKLAGSLEVLRLVACLNLKELPASIYELGNLEFLDISNCQRLEALPRDFNKLERLKIINMSDCKKIKKLPRMVNGLTSLSDVFCDEQLIKQWSRFRQSINVIIAEPTFSLEFLDT